LILLYTFRIPDNFSEGAKKLKKKEVKLRLDPKDTRASRKMTKSSKGFEKKKAKKLTRRTGGKAPHKTSGKAPRKTSGKKTGKKTPAPPVTLKKRR